MYQITPLRTFTKEELLYLLNACAKHLENAYQETHVDSLLTMSMEASMACEFLSCEIAAQGTPYQFH